MQTPETIVVERELAEPTDIRDLAAREAKVAWCLEYHRVAALHSYIALDGRAALCLYRAPDAEAVRATQRTAGVLVTRAWAADVVGPGLTGLAADQEVVVVERELAAPFSPEQAVRLIEAGRGCMELHRTALRVSHLARDGRRMICVYTAPDAESVRLVNRQADMPVSRVWRARVFGL
jgi:hypothetical protein